MGRPVFPLAGLLLEEVEIEARSMHSYRTDETSHLTNILSPCREDSDGSMASLVACMEELQCIALSLAFLPFGPTELDTFECQF